MSRLKTSAFWIFVILALGIGIYAYIYLKNSKKPQVEALSVLPDNCLVYLSTNDFFELNKKINSQSLIADKLKLFGEVNSLCNVLQVLDSLCSSDEDIKEEMKDNPVHFAYYKEKQGWLAVFNIKQLGDQGSLTEQLSEILHATKIKESIYSFRLSGLSLYFNLNEGVVSLSNSQELVSQALIKTSPKLYANKAFQQFKNTLTENSLLVIYVNHSLYTGSAAAGHLNLSYSCKKGYSAGVIDVQPSQIKINGYMKPEEEEIISLFSDQKPCTSEGLTDLLPYNTRFLKAFGFSSYPELRISFPLTSIHIKYWIKANERGLYNVEDDFHANLVNRLLEFETSAPDRKFILAEVNDTLKAAENLKYMSDSLLKKDSLIIYRLNDSIEKPLQLFIPLSLHNTNYALVYSSHVFFADKSEDLVQLIKELKNGRFLNTNESFSVYRNQHFPDDFNYLIYNSPGQMPEEIPSFFNFKKNTAENPFENFRHFSFSVSRHDSAFKFRFHLMNESENLNREQNVLWTLNLDADCNMTATGFTNHNTGENEIVVQDDDNVVYLINAKGTVLWKKKLEEKIRSVIYTVDIYKKNKYQLLFNTENYLHLIDRNGKYVERYPVKLPSGASSPLSLFDYDGDKEYRLIIACKNKNIYNYSIHGLPQEKFTTVKTEDEVNLPVQYIKVGSSDYLVALDKEGKIYTFSRKGVGRIGLRNRTNINCPVFYADAGNSVSSTYLVYVDDKNGLINKISFEDKKDITKLHSETENASVNFSLVDNNRSMDIILTRGNTLQAYNFTGNLITEKTADVSLGFSNYYSDESHSLFYALSEDKTELVVFDQLKAKTKKYKATTLPLISNLFNDNKKYLIITNGRQLSCVLQN